MRFKTLSRRGALTSLVGGAFLAGFILSGNPHPVMGQELSGPVILTITGDVKRPTRGAYDPKTDMFFGYNEIEFGAAATFDFEALARLDIVKLRTDFPKDGSQHEFEGPTLASVLEAAGATGKIAVLKALDGYQIEVPVSELLRNGAVLALKRDGRPLGIGDFGPAHLVFPRAERVDLKDMSDDQWIWSIYHIRIE
jgi:hypothetical protein